MALYSLPPPIPPGRADDHRRAARGVLGQCLDGARGVVLQGGLEHQVLGRVADDHELGEHHQIGPGLCRAGARGADQRKVVVEGADRRIDLGERYGDLWVQGAALKKASVAQTP